jgi:uncharacterized membrane protein
MPRISKTIFIFIIIIAIMIYLVIHISSLIPGTNPFIAVVVVLFLTALIFEQWRYMTKKK